MVFHISFRGAMNGYFYLLLLMLTLVPLSSIELFSAVVDLERLLHSEKHVAQHLKSYVSKENQRLEALMKYLLLNYLLNND